MSKSEPTSDDTDPARCAPPITLLEQGEAEPDPTLLAALLSPENRANAIKICARAAASTERRVYVEHMLALGLPYVENVDNAEPLAGNHALALAELAWNEVCGEGETWSAESDLAAQKLLESGWVPS